MKFSNIKLIISVLTIYICVANFSYATNYDSSSFKINNPVITSGQNNSSSTNFNISQSVSQSVIGKASSTNFQLWSGFQYFFKANSNTLTSTPGNSVVNLSWSVPQTFLGVSVGYYELGVGTSSGNYVFENVGNVTNFTKTGLSNNTTYFFKIRSKTLGGTFLSFSNESSATPSGTNNNSGSGSGNLNSGTNKIIFSGTGYPNSNVFLLKDSNLFTSSVSDSDGNFKIEYSSLNSGNFDFALYAKDPQGKRSPLSLFSVLFSGNQTKEFKNIIIPPTISLNNKKVKQGDSLNVFGFAQKNSKVNIHLVDNGQTKKFEVISGPEGFYNYNLSTIKFNFSVYQIYSFTRYLNSISENSEKLDFEIGEITIPYPNFNGCPQKADLNQDCKVDLVDFSILAYWYLKSNFPTEVDFNLDSKIDLIDFSILAYNWTG